MSYLHLKYNANNPNTQSYQYGSDANGKVCSIFNLSCFSLYDENNIEVGYVQFVDNGIVTETTNNFNDSTQLYNETGTFFITNHGCITYNTSFVSNSVFFASNLVVVPNVISATDEYYNKIDQIAIDTYTNGDRDVWITLLN